MYESNSMRRRKKISWIVTIDLLIDPFMCVRVCVREWEQEIEAQMEDGWASKRWGFRTENRNVITVHLNDYKRRNEESP